MTERTPEEIREEFRESLRQPKLSSFLLFPIIFAGLLILFLVLANFISKGLGISLAVAGALIFAATRMWGNRKGVSVEMMYEEIEQYEASLNNPLHATLLGKFETVLYIVFAFVLTPTIARFLMGPDPGAGATGPGGIIFLGGGFLIAIILAVSLAVFQSNYMRDAYGRRWLVNAAVVLWLVYRFTS